MRSFSLVLVFVAACGVEGEALEGADRDAQLRGEVSLDVVIRNLGTDGEACTTSPASGEVSCLSDELRRPSPIGVGTLASLPVYLCAEGANGALTGCHEETAQYECDSDGDDGSCLCWSFVDCALMILSGDCADSAECDDYGCACTH